MYWPVLADEDRLHRRLHVVVDAAPAGALEKGERPLVGVEHHLLRLARIGAHEHHPAVAEADMGDLHRRRHAVQHDDLMAPVELVGLARREGQRDEGARRRTRMRFAPAPAHIVGRRRIRLRSRAPATPRKFGSASSARASPRPRSRAFVRIARRGCCASPRPWMESRAFVRMARRGCCASPTRWMISRRRREDDRALGSVNNPVLLLGGDRTRSEGFRSASRRS